MKIAVAGAGFTGLAATLRLLEYGHEVTVFEPERELGGLAQTFRLPGWDWAVEKHYHHWFANDRAAISLIRQSGLGDKLVFPSSLTSVYAGGKTYPFNGPSHLLAYSPLPVADRLRTGLVMAYLKLLPMKAGQKLESETAYSWGERWFGKKAFADIWKPLLDGKFGRFAAEVNMAWLWARIKKRTLKLGYLQGGYGLLAETVASRIESGGGRMLLGTAYTSGEGKKYDQAILTVPSPVFVKMYPSLPDDYQKRLMSVPHLHAFNLLLLTKRKILKNTYWLNITDPGFPFIGVIQHTNMVDSRHYGGMELAWVANYLPPDHQFLKLTPDQLFRVYAPRLRQINPRFDWKNGIAGIRLFAAPFAQPVFPVGYSAVRPDFATPIPNVFLANMDMVYPWDRGTNYAIEMGWEVADLVHKQPTS